MLVLYTTCTVAVSSRLQPDYITALVAESQSTHTQRMAEKAQDLADADQSRSATKGKLEGGLGVTDTVMEEIADDEADWDDIYGTQPSRVKEEAVGEDYGKPSAVEKELGSGAAQPVHGESAVSGAEVQKEADVHMEERPSEGGGTLPLAPKGEHVETQQAQDAERTEDGLPAAMVDQGDELVAGDDANMVSTDEPSTRMIAETSQLESSANTAQPALPSQLAEATIASNNEHAQAETEQEDDPEGQTAWDSDPMHDSSSIDTSDISTDSDSDSDSDDGEPPMTAQRLAKMLLDGDGEDDDGGKTSGQAPRTANEQQERAPPKKDITITPDTKITFLGTVDKYVEGILLIIGSTEANYKVLEPDSALCNEQRDNIGVTSDLLGGANKPMYTLHVSEAEVKDFNLSPGAKIYYVDEHSTFVFVKELEAQKHTDASNMHDEEIAMDEQDFSDDEKEAEYKKANKQNKKAGLGKLTRGAFERGDHQATQQGQDTGAYSGPSPRGGRGRGRGARGGGLPFRGTDSRPAFVNNDGGRAAVNLVLDYGDEDGAPSQPAMDPADGYNLNKRPDNYATMSNTPGPAPTESFNPRGGFNDRGRGDRGRGGDRPRGNRDYRGRGQHQAQPQTRTQQFHQYPESQPLQQFTPQYPPQPQYQQTQQFAPQFQQPQQQQDYAQQYWQQYHQQQQQYGQQQPQPQYGQQQYNPQQYAQQPPRATFPGFPNIPLPVSFPPGFVQGQPYVPPKQEQGDGHGYGAGIKREDQ